MLTNVEFVAFMVSFGMGDSTLIAAGEKVLLVEDTKCGSWSLVLIVNLGTCDGSVILIFNLTPSFDKTDVAGALWWLATE